MIAKSNLITKSENKKNYLILIIIVLMGSTFLLSHSNIVSATDNYKLENDKIQTLNPKDAEILGNLEPLIENLKIPKVELEFQRNIKPTPPEKIININRINSKGLDTRDFILTQEFLDEQNGEVISLNFTGEIILENNLIYNNTIILLSNNPEEPTILNCQGHNIRFDLPISEKVAIWVQNNNTIENCNIISGLTESSPDERIGIFLENGAHAEECVVETLNNYDYYDFKIGFYITDLSTANSCEANNNEIGFIIQNSSTLTDSQSHDNLYGFVLNNSIINNCEAIDNVYKGFLLYDSLANNCQAINNDVGFTLHNLSSINHCQSINNDRGFRIEDSGIAINCQAINNSDFGFLISNLSIVSNCQAINNDEGFRIEDSGTAINCQATDNIYGFVLYDSSMARECEVTNNIDGFSMSDESELYNSVAHDNILRGVYLSQGSQILDDIEIYNCGLITPHRDFAGLETARNQTSNAQFSNLYIHDNEFGAHIIGGFIDSNSRFCNNGNVIISGENVGDLLEEGITYINNPRIYANNIGGTHNGIRNVSSCVNYWKSEQNCYT